jgi:hypothetical protein
MQRRQHFSGLPRLSRLPCMGFPIAPSAAVDPFSYTYIRHSASNFLPLAFFSTEI